MEAAKPLAGIRVVELATMVAVPTCGRMLAYMGAEVIKIESLEGEPYRKYKGMTGDEPVIFDMFNMQKKSVSIDAKKPEGKEYVMKLLETADVFITNVRTQSLERLGLTYEQLKIINPKLVYAHFSGYGETGPLKDLPGYDLTAFFARFGVLRDFVDPDHYPSNIIPGLGDAGCGMCMAMNITSALLGRVKSGVGEKIESSLNQVGVWMMMMPMIYAQYGISYAIKNGGTPVDISNATYRCGDGEYILVACGTLQQAHSFLRALGLTHLIDDERCKSIVSIYQNTPTLFPEVASQFLKHSAEEWVHILRANDIPCERHRHTPEIATDEQLLANGFIYSPGYKNNDITVPNPPISFASVNLSVNERGPALGQHTAEVLTELGCSQEKLEAMQNDGVIKMA